MTTLAEYFALDLAPPSAEPPARAPLLIGDVATVRAGVPELLIQIARSRGEDDPQPMR